MSTGIGNLTQYTIDLIAKRGITVDQMAKLLRKVQSQYIPDLTFEQCKESILMVMEKREVQNAVMTGIALDVLTEQGHIEEPLASILKRDDALYGVDEILALSIVNIYGSIGLTNFGYLDKAKVGIISDINEKRPGVVNTFLDDLVSAIIAAGASRIAHRHRDEENKEGKEE